MMFNKLRGLGFFCAWLPTAVSDDCQVENCPECEVHNLTVVGVTRCYTLYTPSTGTRPTSGWPVMVYFHGMGGQAKQTCSTQRPYGQDDYVTNPEYAEQLGFALLCADAGDNWQFPTVSGTVVVQGPSKGQSKDADPGVGGDNKRPCTTADTPDAEYVEKMLGALESSNTYDSDRIYFMGFSQGAMMTAWASTCFAHKIRGAVQTGSGLKVAGDGNNIPGGACETQCDACEFFPIQPGSTEAPLINVVGEGLKWCQYAGCDDYLLGSILSMDEYLTSIGADHEVRYYDGAHEPPTNWFPMIAQCHGWPNAPVSAGSGAHWLNSCATAPSVPVVDGTGCDANVGSGSRSGGGGVPLACTAARTTFCCGDGTCNGLENADNCADCQDTEPAAPAPAGGHSGGGGVPPACTAERTTLCCGDGICGGPENADNCADCQASPALPAPAAPAPVGGRNGGGGGDVPPACTAERTTLCCGDGICGGPENADNCADCQDTEQASPALPAPAAPAQVSLAEQLSGQRLMSIQSNGIVEEIVPNASKRPMRSEARRADNVPPKGNQGNPMRSKARKSGDVLKENKDKLDHQTIVRKHQRMNPFLLDTTEGKKKERIPNRPMRSNREKELGGNLEGEVMAEKELKVDLK